MQVALQEIAIDLKRPLVTGRGVVERRRGFRVEIREGASVGLGEATPPEEFGHDTAEAAERALQGTLAALSAAAAPGSIPEIRALMSGLAPLGSSAAARHAVELALLDLVAATRGIPVRVLLSSDARTRVRVNALITGDEDAASAVARGFETLKLKVGGQPIANDVERVKAVRARVGRAPKLRIDPNGAWSEPEAIRALQSLARFDLELCEQPVLDPDAMLRVRAETRIPIAADESLALPSWQPAFAAGNVDVLVLKPMVLGGLLPALDLALEAQHSETGAYVTSSIDGEIARAGAAHLAAAIPQTSWAHGLATGDLLRDPGQTSWLTPTRGEIALPDSPGLGLEQ
ncbi:MAG TPA: enolase C-terminal domain-like protein [Myxococcaceae bacterium]